MLKRCSASSNVVCSALQCVLWGVSYDGECACGMHLMSSTLCTALLVLSWRQDGSSLRDASWSLSSGTAALFTVAQQHPAVKAATPQ